jgi:hypothetical protein
VTEMLIDGYQRRLPPNVCLVVVVRWQWRSEIYTWVPVVCPSDKGHLLLPSVSICRCLRNCARICCGRKCAKHNKDLLHHERSNGQLRNTNVSRAQRILICQQIFYSRLPEVKGRQKTGAVLNRVEQLATANDEQDGGTWRRHSGH